MDWFILVVAGLFETAFAFCLGRMNEVKGKSGVDRHWDSGHGAARYRMLPRAGFFCPDVLHGDADRVRYWFENSLKLE